MARKCAFCPADAVKHGGEHVWDNWINKVLLKTLTKKHFFARKRYSLKSPEVSFKATKLNEQLPVVCSKCNSEWMSALSSKVKERFERAMLRAEPFSLGARDAAILSAFTFMKAVIMDHTSKEYEPFFTRADRERFRSTLAVPPHIKAWMAAYQGRARLSVRSECGIVSADADPLFRRIEFFSFTYIVGNLALQLFAPRWKDVRDRGRPLISLTPNRSWNPAAPLFWPHDGRVLSWPPQNYLGDDVIQAFVQRFADPIRLPV